MEKTRLMDSIPKSPLGNCVVHNARIFPYSFATREVEEDSYGVKYKEHFTRETFPSGMASELSFWAEGTQRDTYLNVSLVVFGKRNKAWKEPKATTGKDGLLPLFWARDAILHIPFYANRRLNLPKEFYMEIGAIDERRFIAYKRCLQDHGFLVKHDDTRTMQKTFDNEALGAEYFSWCFNEWCLAKAQANLKIIKELEAESGEKLSLEDF